MKAGRTSSAVSWLAFDAQVLRPSFATVSACRCATRSASPRPRVEELAALDCGELPCELLLRCFLPRI